MPRVSKEAKAESHKRIVEEAARQFREKGVEATGVADVMKAAGMTHGGFYRHFGSKDELAAAAIAKAFDDILAKMETVLTRGDGRSGLMNFVNYYLSPEHVQNPRMGCPIVALGSEVAHGSDAEREAMSDGMDQIISRMAKEYEGSGEDERQKALSLLSLMVGTVLLARSNVSPEKMQDILMSSRQLAEKNLLG